MPLAIVGQRSDPVPVVAAAAAVLRWIQMQAACTKTRRMPRVKRRFHERSLRWAVLCGEVVVDGTSRGWLGLARH